MIANLPRINQQVSRLQTFHTRYHALKNLIKGVQRTVWSRDKTPSLKIDEVQAWARLKAEDILITAQSAVRDDGICLADMAVNLSGGKSVRESVSVNSNIKT